MRWDKRRIAMLDAMGIRLWGPGARAEPAREPAADVPVGPAATAVATSGVASRGAAASRGVAVAVVALAGTEPAVVPPARTVPVTVAPAVAPPGVVGLRPASVAATGAMASLATLDWQALRAAAAGCTACALCAGRTRSVFGGANASADWLIVGEPPTEAEDREGAPLVGKPGQLLDNMLRAIGVGRAVELGVPAGRACVTVPVKCRPPGNRPPSFDEVATCEAYLARQIALVAPKVILALGRAAPLLLRSDEPLGRLRSRVHRYQGLPLVATYPPAYLLRQPADKARAWDDLCLALEAVQGGGMAPGTA